jgi:hypothetical protein
MTRAVINRIGEKAYLDLVEQSMKLVKPTREFLLDVITYYEGRV